MTQWQNLRNFWIVLGLPMFIGEVAFVPFRNDEDALIMKALKELTEKITTINFKKEELFDKFKEKPASAKV
jgi:hypothetical protein